MQLQAGKGIAQRHGAASALPLSLAPATAGEPAFHQSLRILQEPEQQTVAAAVLAPEASANLDKRLAFLL